ncbi:TetR/AcrR family transcriptional regulator [Neorhizobium galegae]|uniref:TetR/AcrR family transcriptional regulator n=1 Tax=Neorhizobium galegae TaxID=399 RepID=UPI0027D7CFD3|nr:TetR/AcrR family transcriptional regulator [Neorhizobium galegae]
MDTRNQIVGAADRLFYERGYDVTSFADIAECVGLSRGNFYYHFKTKDEILSAVIALRVANTRRMLDAWEAESETPAERIRSFINILIVNRTKIMAYGCPVGSLCNELAKLDHVAKTDAAALFTLFQEWLARQFCALGRETDADVLSLHLLMRSQGVSTLATAFCDETFVRREVDAMHMWLEAHVSERPSPAQSVSSQAV